MGKSIPSWVADPHATHIWYPYRSCRSSTYSVDRAVTPGKREDQQLKYFPPWWLVL